MPLRFLAQGGVAPTNAGATAPTNPAAAPLFLALVRGGAEATVTKVGAGGDGAGKRRMAAIKTPAAPLILALHSLPC